MLATDLLQCVRTGCNKHDRAQSITSALWHHSCYRDRYIILFSPDISAVEHCNRVCVFPYVVIDLSVVTPFTSSLGFKSTNVCGVTTCDCLELAYPAELLLLPLSHPSLRVSFSSTKIRKNSAGWNANSVDHKGRSHQWVGLTWDRSKSKAIWMWTLECELKSI